MSFKSGKWLAVFLFGSFVLSCAVAHADEKSEEKDNQKVDTEFIFGFTEGADVGEIGEKELELQTITSLGKRSGHYTAMIIDLRYEHVPFENFRFEFGWAL